VTVPRIVVADNDPDALDLLVLDLGLEGHEIVGAAASGEEAVSLCESLRPDVLVVDYRMPPGPDGLEVVRRLRRSMPELRMVVYSNYQNQRLHDAAERLGATYLAKGQLAALRRAVSAA
jgi:CheY-like chemotaxis protein